VPDVPDVWAVAAAYERYVGRWSRVVARQFLRLLDSPAGLRFLDVGCGAGALIAAIAATGSPSGIVGVDPATGLLAHARDGLPANVRCAVCAGDAQRLPFRDHSVDIVVSGLALNFVPDPLRAAGEMARVVAPGGVVAGYVWDYADRMRLIRYFWDAAVAIDPAAHAFDEAHRFPLCRPRPLRDLWTAAGLRGTSVEAIDVPTRFADFEDYWTPFLGGQGPAPAYVSSLTERQRDALRDLLRARLPADPDGGIPLTARAWAVRGSAS
jgi:SAM-dependent methyltransferase